jgi:hypothetical protein
MSQDEEFSHTGLQKSIQKIGQLYPILVNEKGEVLDGNNRLKDNPNPDKKVVVTKNRYEDLMVRASAHYRRRVSQEERKSVILEMAKEAEKLGIPKNKIASKIVDDLPHAESYVLRLIPDEYKDIQKASAGKQGADISQQKRDLEKAERKAMAARVQCSNPACLEFVPESDVMTVEGKPFCQKCAPAARVEALNREKAKKKLEQKPTKPTQVERYTDKLARMHNGVSRMDEVQHEKAKESVELRLLGWITEFQKEYLVVICKSDLTLTRTRGGIPQEIAVFWDGQDAHPDPDRDEANRAWAQEEQKRRLGVRMEVFARTYKAYSPALADSLWNELMEFVKELDKWDEKPAVQEESE